jgi:hypothetical protein
VSKSDGKYEAFISVGVNSNRAARCGFEVSSIYIAGRRYLDRFLAYVGVGTVRLHKFWRGDDDRASHDHPWPFITFPFTSYTEEFWQPSRFVPSLWVRDTRVVKAWRFHYRPAKFRHIVLGRADGKGTPFWTFVITGPVTNEWGFWPKPNEFVPWRDWL